MVRLLRESLSVGAYSALAQLVEQLTVNQRVAGSSPAGGANFSPCSMGHGGSSHVASTSMKVSEIGKSGILASVVGFGTAGIQETSGETNISDKEIIKIIHAATDKGVNFIDTAPSYGWGRAESIIGRAISDRADRVIIATKCGVLLDDLRGSFIGVKNGHKAYLSLEPTVIVEEVEASLRRLNREYIDLLQCHKPSIPPAKTPIEETMSCLMNLKKAGKVRAIGISNVSLEELDSYRRAGELDSNQFRYSMLSREAEQEQTPFCKKHEISGIAYWCLEQGLLAGGVSPDRVFGEGDFRSDAADWLPWFRIENRRRLQDMFSRWKDLTEKYECSIGNISTAWTLGQPGVTHVLLGNRSAQQAISNAYAGSFRLDKGDMKRIDADLIGLGPAV